MLIRKNEVNEEPAEKIDESEIQKLIKDLEAVCPQDKILKPADYAIMNEIVKDISINFFNKLIEDKELDLVNYFWSILNQNSIENCFNPLNKFFVVPNSMEEFHSTFSQQCLNDEYDYCVYLLWSFFYQNVYVHFQNQSRKLSGSIGKYFFFDHSHARAFSEKIKKNNDENRFFINFSASFNDIGKIILKRGSDRDEKLDEIQRFLNYSAYAIDVGLLKSLQPQDLKAIGEIIDEIQSFLNEQSKKKNKASDKEENELITLNCLCNFLLKLSEALHPMDTYFFQSSIKLQKIIADYCFQTLIPTLFQKSAASNTSWELISLQNVFFSNFGPKSLKLPIEDHPKALTVETKLCSLDQEENKKMDGSSNNISFRVNSPIKLPRPGPQINDDSVHLIKKLKNSSGDLEKNKHVDNLHNIIKEFLNKKEKIDISVKIKQLLEEVQNADEEAVESLFENLFHEHLIFLLIHARSESKEKADNNEDLPDDAVYYSRDTITQVFDTLLKMAQTNSLFWYKLLESSMENLLKKLYKKEKFLVSLFYYKLLKLNKESPPILLKQKKLLEHHQYFLKCILKKNYADLTKEEIFTAIVLLKLFYFVLVYFRKEFTILDEQILYLKIQDMLSQVIVIEVMPCIAKEESYTLFGAHSQSKFLNFAKSNLLEIEKSFSAKLENNSSKMPFYYYLLKCFRISTEKSLSFETSKKMMEFFYGEECKNSMKLEWMLENDIYFPFFCEYVKIFNNFLLCDFLIIDKHAARKDEKNEEENKKNSTGNQKDDPKNKVDQKDGVLNLQKAELVNIQAIQKASPEMEENDFENDDEDEEEVDSENQENEDANEYFDQNLGYFFKNIFYKREFISKFYACGKRLKNNIKKKYEKDKFFIILCPIFRICDFLKAVDSYKDLKIMMEVLKDTLEVLSDSLGFSEYIPRIFIDEKKNKLKKEMAEELHKNIEFANETEFYYRYVQYALMSFLHEEHLWIFKKCCFVVEFLNEEEDALISSVENPLNKLVPISKQEYPKFPLFDLECDDPDLKLQQQDIFDNMEENKKVYLSNMAKFLVDCLLKKTTSLYTDDNLWKLLRIMNHVLQETDNFNEFLFKSLAEEQKKDFINLLWKLIYNSYNNLRCTSNLWHYMMTQDRFLEEKKLCLVMSIIFNLCDNMYTPFKELVNTIIVEPTFEIYDWCKSCKYWNEELQGIMMNQILFIYFNHEQTRPSKTVLKLTRISITKFLTEIMSGPYRPAQDSVTEIIDWRDFASKIEFFDKNNDETMENLELFYVLSSGNEPPIMDYLLIKWKYKKAVEFIADLLTDALKKFEQNWKKKKIKNYQNVLQIMEELYLQDSGFSKDHSFQLALKFYKICLNIFEFPPYKWRKFNEELLGKGFLPDDTGPFEIKCNNKVAIEFFKDIIGHVEIVAKFEGQSVKQVAATKFVIPKHAYFLSNKTKEDIMENVNLEDPQGRVSFLLDRMHLFEIEASCNYKLYQRYGKAFELYNPDNIGLATKLIYVNIIIMNIISIVTYRWIDGTNFENAYTGSRVTLIILASFNIFNSTIFFIGWLMFRRNTLVRLLFTSSVNPENLKTMLPQLNNAVNSKKRLKSLTQEVIDFFNYLYKVLVLGFLTQKDILMFLYIIICSILYLATDSPIPLGLQLLLIADINPTCKYVVKSVTTNFGQLFMTFFLGISIIFCYSLIITQAYHKQLAQLSVMLDFTNENTEEEESFCDTALNCWLYLMNFGTRNSGPADILIQPNYHQGGPYFGRYVTDMSFYIIINLIILNIVFGIILDAFAALRDKQQLKGNIFLFQKCLTRVDQIKTSKCFICNLDTSDFSRFGQSFQTHTEKYHNPWDYIFFLGYLLKLGGTKSMSGIEKLVYENFQSKDYTFVPLECAYGMKDSDEKVDDKVDRLVGVAQDISKQIETLQTSMKNSIEELRKGTDEKINQVLDLLKSKAEKNNPN